MQPRQLIAPMTAPTRSALPPTPTKRRRRRIARDAEASSIEDWEEINTNSHQHPSREEN